MPSAGYLRRQADICLRLALIASDEAASSRLLAIYQDYIIKAEEMETHNQQPDGAMARSDAPPDVAEHGPGMDS
jgi:hypothetical protein